MKVKKDSKSLATDDPIRDLFDGVIDPYDYLVTVDALDVQCAVLKVKVFLQKMKIEGLIEEI